METLLMEGFLKRHKINLNKGWGIGNIDMILSPECGLRFMIEYGKMVCIPHPSMPRYGDYKLYDVVEVVATIEEMEGFLR